MKNIKEVYENLLKDYKDCKIKYYDGNQKITIEIETYKIVASVEKVTFYVKNYEVTKSNPKTIDDIYLIIKYYINNRKKIGHKKTYSELAFFLIMTVAFILLILLLGFMF